MLKFEKRENTPTKLRVLIPLISVLIGLIIGAIAIALAGINPLSAFKAIIIGSFGSKYTFTETLVFATPLILISVGLILVFKMNFWNIGAYGQYIVGAIASAYFALFLPPSTSKPLFLLIMVIAGMIGGAFWAFIPAVLKAYWDVNEVISTLLLNFVALYFLKYLMYGPWRDPTSHGFPLSKMFPNNAQLYKIIPNSRVHLGLIFGIVAALIIWYIIKKTRLGYEMRIIGGSKDAALYAGINVKRNII
ncbi:MAG: ABC transporter permease, partial [Caldisericaceae bacterium]